MKLATSLLAASSLAATASAQSMSFSMGQTEMIWDGGQWVPAETWGGGKSGKGGKPTAKSAKSSKSSKSTSKEWWSAAPTVSNAPSSEEKEWSDWKGGKSGKSSKSTSDDKWSSGKSGKWSSKDWWSPPTPPPTPEPVCGDGTYPVVGITDAANRYTNVNGTFINQGPLFNGDFYNFTDTLDNLNCLGRVDFVAEVDIGPAHPFRLCVGGITDQADPDFGEGETFEPNPPGKCGSKFQTGCGTECYGYSVGNPDGLEKAGDCVSIDISGRELWYVCTQDRHDMYNKLC